MKKILLIGTIVTMGIALFTSCRQTDKKSVEADDFTGKNLIEKYGVRIDPVLHEEILARYEKLNLAPYSGFVNPVLKPVMDANGNITDITFEYCSDFLGQMMWYGKQYSYLN